MMFSGGPIRSMYAAFKVLDSENHGPRDERSSSIRWRMPAKKNSTFNLLYRDAPPTHNCTTGGTHNATLVGLIVFVYLGVTETGVWALRSLIARLMS